MNNERLYNIFMDLIGKLSNEELLKLSHDLQEFVDNDEAFGNAREDVCGFDKEKELERLHKGEWIIWTYILTTF